MKPIDIIKKFAKQGMQPEELLMTMMQNNSDPMMNNLVTMAKQGRKEELQAFARNIMKEKGMDFDKEFSKFMQQIKR